MLSFILVDATGTEVRAVDSPNAESLGAPGDGMQWIEVPHPVQKWTVALIDEEFRAVPRIRSASRALEVTRSAKATDLLVARRTFEERPIAVGGATFLGDAESRTMIANAMVLAREFEESTGQPFTTVWKLASGGVVTLSRAQLRGLALAIGARVQTAFVREAQLRAALAAATTLEAVAAIQWTDPT